MSETHLEVMKEVVRRIANDPKRKHEFEQGVEVAQALLAVIMEERFKEVAYHVLVIAFYLAGKSLVEARSHIIPRKNSH